VAKLLEKLNQQEDIKYFDLILSREQCSTNEKGHEIKDLDFFTAKGSNRDIKDCVIVDNSVLCF